MYFHTQNCTKILLKRPRCFKKKNEEQFKQIKISSIESGSSLVRNSSALIHFIYKEFVHKISNFGTYRIYILSILIKPVYNNNSFALCINIIKLQGYPLKQVSITFAAKGFYGAKLQHELVLRAVL